VVLADYRRTPEHPFPAALEDALAVLRAATALRDSGEFAEVVLTGDSAGGGLAFGAVVGAIDRGDSLPDALIGASPLLDLTVAGDSHEWNAEADPAVSKTGLGIAAQHLLGETDPTRTPTASPLAATSEQLARFPGTMLMASTTEILLSDSLTMTARLAQAGSNVLLHVEPLVPHVWPIFWGTMPQARRALSLMASFLASRGVMGSEHV
jgi:phosphinothricin tripeptide acetyl hydrolase